MGPECFRKGDAMIAKSEMEQTNDLVEAVTGLELSYTDHDAAAMGPVARIVGHIKSAVEIAYRSDFSKYSNSAEKEIRSVLGVAFRNITVSWREDMTEDDALDMLAEFLGSHADYPTSSARRRFIKKIQSEEKIK